MKMQQHRPHTGHYNNTESGGTVMINLTKKTKFALAAAILLICGLLFFGLYLRAHADAAYTPSGTSRAPEAERPRVTLKGSGYEVNDAQATPLKNPDHLFIKKVVKKKTAPKPKKKTTTAKKPQPKTKKTTAARKKPSDKTQEINKNARSGRSIQITTSIPKGCATDKKSYEFTVTAKTASGKSIPSSDIKLTRPKKYKRLSSGKYNDKYSAKFSIDLDSGTNTIIIKATDKKTKTSSTLEKTVYRYGKYPYIETSLENGMKIPESYIDFTVEGADENGKPVTHYTDETDEGDVSYYFEAETFTPYNEDKDTDVYDDDSGEQESCDYIGNSKYRVQLRHGKNIILIDMYKKNSEGNYEGFSEIVKTIYCTSKPTGTVKAGIEAKTLSLGKLSPDKKIKIYPNDDTDTVAKRYLKSAGFHVTVEGAGWEISKKDIAANAKVPKKLIAAMKADEDYNDNEKTSHRTDSISYEDFYSDSNWIFYINGKDYYTEAYSIKKFKNLQKITIAFSLTGDGKDLDGTLKW